jgi:hypothetical protein
VSRRPRRVLFVALALTVQVALCYLPAIGGASGTTAPSPPEMRVPLASAVTTPTGSWAVVAMGQLGHPLNTFWELFYRAPSASLWHLVTPPGVADNGGLVVSVAGDGAVTVGFERSQLLRYSPLAMSRNDGASWVPALVPMSLVTTPDALAVTSGGAGTALALVRGGAGQVLTAKGPLLSWHALSGDRLLASGSDAGCGATGLDAVDLTSSNIPLVGTGCRRAGQVGIFAHLGARWELIGPSLRSSLSRTTTRILRLDSSGVTTTALLAEEGRGGVGLVGLWDSTTGTWTESLPLPLGGAPTLRASALGSSGQQLVFVEVHGKPAMLEEAVGSGQPWHQLPAPPTGTETVSIQADGSINAFSIDGSNVRIFTLALNGASWSLSQKLNVPIAYGSS